MEFVGFLYGIIVWYCIVYCMVFLYHYEALQKISEWMISVSQSFMGDNLFKNTFTQTDLIRV